MLNQILNLERPLAVLDLETTGLNPDIDRIVQIAITIHYPKKDPIAWSSLINPEIPIMNTGNHNITDAHVAEAPLFKIVAPALAPRMTDIDIAGYNVTFDINFLKAEMRRAGVTWGWNGHVIDALQIYRIKRGHTLSNAYIEFGGEDGSPLPPGSTFDAHDAGNDVVATEIVLRGQLLRFSNLPRTVKELADFCFPHPINSVDATGKFVWVGEDIGFNFGKWRGKLLKDPQVRGYLHWIANVGDFSEEVKEIAQDALDGVFPEKG